MIDHPEISRVATEPFPPYTGIDADYSASSMYSEPSEPVLSVYPDDASAAEFEILPLEAHEVDGNLVAAAGGVGNFTVAEKTEEDPADGVWYYSVRAEIDPETGDVTGANSGWVTAEPANTARWFYQTIAQATVDGDTITLTQFNYGPLFVIPYGETTERWGVLIL